MKKGKLKISIKGLNKLRKYRYPENLEDWQLFLSQIEDKVLKKFWRFLPKVETKLESNIVLQLTDEMLSRDLL